MMLRLAFHLALRQTEGLMACIFVLLDVPLSAPAVCTMLSRCRSSNLCHVIRFSTVEDAPFQSDQDRIEPVART